MCVCVFVCVKKKKESRMCWKDSILISCVSVSIPKIPKAERVRVKKAAFLSCGKKSTRIAIGTKREKDRQCTFKIHSQEMNLQKTPDSDIPVGLCVCVCVCVYMCVCVSVSVIVCVWY